MSELSAEEQVADYREKIINEIFYALGLSRTGAWRRMLGPLFRLPAGRLGRIAARGDSEVRSSGITGGARRILPDLSLHVSVRGAENIPEYEPLLVASNHPGALDSLAIMSCIPRRDLKVFLSDVPFTRAFSAARKYFIYVPPGSAGRMTAVRASIGHLQSGGALLIFAHGDVEPDPELSPDASESFEDWSRSVEIMLRRVPDTWLLVTIVSGVLMPRFVHCPFVKIRKSAPRRQKLAEVLQMSQQMILPRSVRASVHVSFAKPIRGRELPDDDMMPAVIKIGRQLLEDHMASLSIIQKNRLWFDY